MTAVLIRFIHYRALYAPSRNPKRHGAKSKGGPPRNRDKHGSAINTFPGFRLLRPPLRSLSLSPQT